MLYGMTRSPKNTVAPPQPAMECANPGRSVGMHLWAVHRSYGQWPALLSEKGWPLNGGHHPPHLAAATTVKTMLEQLAP